MIKVLNVHKMLSEQSGSSFENSYYNISKVPLLLIRPDGQIAWRPDNLDIDILSVFNQIIPQS